MASWPQAGLVHANLWTGFSKFLQTPLDYKVNDLGVARSGRTITHRDGWLLFYLGPFISTLKKPFLSETAPRLLLIDWGSLVQRLFALS